MSSEAKDGEGPKLAPSSIVPEVYYDLIARVPAGVLLICFSLEKLITEQHRSIPTITTWLSANSVPILLLGSLLIWVGGLVGILIAPLANRVKQAYWKRSWVAIVDKGPFSSASILLNSLGCRLVAEKTAWSSLSSSTIHGVDRWINDYLLQESQTARSILVKIRAEADLCANLAAALILLPIVRIAIYIVLAHTSITPGTANRDIVTELAWGAVSWLFAFLVCFPGAYRTQRLALRMLAMLAVIHETSRSAGKSIPKK
jgi:hypothetical protein